MEPPVSMDYQEVADDGFQESADPPSLFEDEPLPGRAFLQRHVRFHQGSFSVSTIAIAASLLMLLLTIVAFVSAGLFAGVGLGLALVGLML